MVSDMAVGISPVREFTDAVNVPDKYRNIVIVP